MEEIIRYPFADRQNNLLTGVSIDVEKEFRLNLPQSKKIIDHNLIIPSKQVNHCDYRYKSHTLEKQFIQDFEMPEIRMVNRRYMIACYK